MKKDAAVGFHIQEDNTESKLNEFPNKCWHAPTQSI